MFKRLFLTALILCLSVSAWGAIAFDAAVDDTNAGAASLTFSHTCTGDNLILFVGVSSGSGTTLPTGVTYGGEAMSLVNSGTRTTVLGALYMKVGPLTGANNVVITYAGAQGDIIGVAVSYTGAKQSGQPNTSATADDFSDVPSAAITTTVNNTLAVALIAHNTDGRVITPDGTQTERSDKAGSQSHLGFSDDPVVTAGAKTMSSVTPGGNTRWVTVVSAIVPLEEGNFFFFNEED